MAFVFKEERKTDVIPNTELGPGEYLPQTIPKKVKLNDSTPFESKEPRLKSATNLNPGPGSYYFNDSELKLQKMVAQAEIANFNQDELIAQEIVDAPYDSKEPNKTKYVLRPNKEKLGFEVKEKRFKNPNNEVPGPGQYFTQKKRAVSARPMEIKNRLKKQFPDNKVASIPYRNNNGFDIGPDGELIKIKDPLEFKQFKGEGEDTVGPGSYQLDDPEKWHKAGPSWSKMTSSRMASANPNRIQSTNSTRPGTAMEIRIQSSKKPKVYNLSRVASAQREKRKENIKKLYKDEVLHSTNKDTTASYYEEFLKFTNKQNPGPGYYIDIEKESDFHSIPYPETRQFFGSNIERFPAMKTNPAIGPTTYFVGCDSALYKQPTQAMAPFSTRSKRFTTSKNDRINKTNPGPGAYDPKIRTQIEKNHFNNKVTTFNLRQKRFDERNSNLQWQMNTPGPGSYINTYTATGTSNTILINGLYIDLKRGKEIMRPRSSAPRILKENRDIQPAVGTYDPQKIFTIGYNAKKKANEKKFDNIAFNTHKERKPKKNEQSNIGPGFYYREKPINKKQVFPPFHQSDIKFRNAEGIEIGPGQYDSRSYFDWNKKTYNVSFI